MMLGNDGANDKGWHFKTLVSITIFLLEIHAKFFYTFRI